ncbi:hypothetical protein J3R82DRAFT_1270 [Butyriboletus roseoflavus]|nr:hypothetical protein J3R82DRAFT_1270 [Butyriboletus roseoflavus]
MASFVCGGPIAHRVFSISRAFFKYLQSFLHAELHILSHHRPIVLSELEEADEEAAASRLEVTERVLRKALALCGE